MGNQPLLCTETEGDDFLYLTQDYLCPSVERYADIKMLLNAVKNATIINMSTSRLSFERICCESCDDVRRFRVDASSFPSSRFHEAVCRQRRLTDVCVRGF